MFTFLLTISILFVSAAEYRVLVLGDIHYDAPEYHIINPELKLKMRSEYIKMWKGKTPQLLTASAKLLDKDVPFVIQSGDFTQGDGVSIKHQEKMFTDGFAAVKKFFPNHKLLAVKGNHDIRTYAVKKVKDKDTLVRVETNAPAANAFMPLIAKELGVESIKDHYSVVHNNDLFIFYDGFARPQSNSIKYLKATLDANPKVRNVFFITHLPVIACSTGNPGWMLYNYVNICKLLMSRNAIILTAHTHQPSLVQVNDGKNTLTQFVTSSIGYRWAIGKPSGIWLNTIEDFQKNLYKKKAGIKRSVAALKHLNSLPVKVFEMYQNANGFTILKISDKGVFAEVYNDDSGKPALVKQLK